MKKVATAWFWLVVATTLPCGYLIALGLWLVTAPFDTHRRTLHFFVSFWCHQYLKVCWPWWRVQVAGRENLPRGPCVIIANHQSMVDIIALMGLRHAFKFVSKASLFHIPFIGWMMRLMRYVAIERGRLPSMQEMMIRCEGLLRAGESVLIFPEATYASGPARLPFRRGAFRLAQRCQVPIVPVVLTGTSELLFEDGPWFSPSSRVKVSVMAPFPPPAMDADDGELVRALEHHYSEWLGQPFARR